MVRLFYRQPPEPLGHQTLVVPNCAPFGTDGTQNRDVRTLPHAFIKLAYPQQDSNLRPPDSESGVLPLNYEGIRSRGADGYVTGIIRLPSAAAIKTVMIGQVATLAGKNTAITPGSPPE